jgi:hypothetical protein
VSAIAIFGIDGEIAGITAETHKNNEGVTQVLRHALRG